jgi:hypothetical protein
LPWLGTVETGESIHSSHKRRELAEIARPLSMEQISR